MDELADTLAVEAARLVLAVRERRDASSEGTLRARLQLVEAYAEAGFHDDAIDLLNEAAIDGSRIFGPLDERSRRIRLRLGEQHLSNGEPLMALTVLVTLEHEVAGSPASDPTLDDAIRAVATRAASVALRNGHLSAKELAACVPAWCLP